MMRLILSIFLFFLFFTSFGCKSWFKEKTNWSVSLDKNDNKPYGGLLAFETTKILFRECKTMRLSPAFRYNVIDESMMKSRRPNLLIAVGLDFYVNEEELNKLIEFVKNGNDLVIVSRTIDHKLEKIFNINILDNQDEERPLNSINNGKNQLEKLSLNNYKSDKKFGFQGRSIHAYFDKRIINEEFQNNSFSIPEIISKADTLGYFNSKPNILRFNISNGSITFLAAPLTWSNYFLLQENNIEYFNRFWNFFPKKYNLVYWNDYYKRSQAKVDLSVLFQYPSTKWAFILLIVTLLIYVLFESKRKQNIIDEIPIVENSSVSFAQTVGRLYFNKGNHSNLADKMIIQFLDWVRQHYFIPTNQLDEIFITKLSQKSNQPIEKIKELNKMIQKVRIQKQKITQDELAHIYLLIHSIYNSKV